MKNSKYDKEELEDLILVQNLSYEEIGRMFNCTGSNIKKVAKRLGIDLPQRRKINSNETFNKDTVRKQKFCKNCGKDMSFKSGNIYCDNDCQHEFQAKEKYKKFLEGDESIQRANYNPKFAKPFILKEQDNKCIICGIGPIWNDKKLVFVLDHVDSNAANNTRKNLRLVCPNCDSQLDTYKSKNKNGARSYYRYRKENISTVST